MLCSPSALTPTAPYVEIIVNLYTLIPLQSTSDESVPPKGILCIYWVCMQDRGHISKCGDAQTNKDTGVHTHTHTDTHTLHIHLCSTSRMNKPVMQRTNSRTTSLCFVCLSLPLFTKINQVCIWRPFLLPLPVTSGMKEWVREKAGREEEGNSQKRRREYRHSWVVNCNNPSLLSRPTRIRSKRPGGRYDPKTYACTHTHTYT